MILAYTVPFDVDALYRELTAGTEPQLFQIDPARQLEGSCSCGPSASPVQLVGEYACQCALIPDGEIGYAHRRLSAQRIWLEQAASPYRPGTLAELLFLWRSGAPEGIPVAAAGAMIWMGGPQDPHIPWRTSAVKWYYLVLTSGRGAGGRSLVVVDEVHVAERFRSLHWLVLER